MYKRQVLKAAKEETDQVRVRVEKEMVEVTTDQNGLPAAAEALDPTSC